MNILLTGASGFIGNHLLRFLVQQGHMVTACCRHPERLLLNTQNCIPLRMDFATADSIASWLPHLSGIDAVINCVGIIAETKRQTFTQLHTRTPVALFQAAAQIGIKKIIQISALGADEKAQSPYHLSKRSADDDLRNLPVDWFVLQPSIVYGHGAQSTALFHALAGLPLHILPDTGRQQLQPIHVDDVVAAVRICLEPSTPAQQTIALVGPAPIRYADLLYRLRQRLGKPPARTLAVPQRYVLVAANFAQWLGEPILSQDNIAMFSRGNTADTQALATLLTRSPKCIAQHLFTQPASQAERWHAQLYFLKPLCGLVIALVWLWSGITSLFFYPHASSYQLLAATGISGIAAPIVLYGLAVLDIALGIATLCRYQLSRLLLWQIAIVVGYSSIVALTLPEFLIHPFGALLKNLPFLLILWIYRQLEGEKPCSI